MPTETDRRQAFVDIQAITLALVYIAKKELASSSSSTTYHYYYYYYQLQSKLQYQTKKKNTTQQQQLFFLIIGLVLFYFLLLITIIIIIHSSNILIIVGKFFRDCHGSQLSVDIMAFVYNQCNFTASKNQAEAKRTEPANVVFPELVTCL